MNKLCVLLKRDTAVLSVNRSDKCIGNTNLTDDANLLFQILWGELLYTPFLSALCFFAGTFIHYLPVDFFFFPRIHFTLTENVSYPFLTDESKLRKYCAFYHFPLEAVTLV